MSFINFALNVFVFVLLVELYLTNNIRVGLGVLIMTTIVNIFKSLMGNERLDSLEERVDRLEKRMDNLEERMDRLEERMDRLEIRVERIEGKVDEILNLLKSKQ